MWVKMQVILLISHTSNFRFIEPRIQNLVEAKLIDRTGVEENTGVVFAPLVWSLSVPPRFFSSQTWQTVTGDTLHAV